MARYTHERYRPFLLFNNAFIWISSLIVMGILSYFIHLYGNLGEHVVFEEVIAVLTVVFWIPVVFLSFRGDHTYSLPTNLIFSYLWLTAFIFTAEEYTWQGCDSNWPLGRCHLKHTVEAFSFLSFFFLFLNVIIEGTSFYTGTVGGVGTGSVLGKNGHHHHAPGTTATTAV